MKELWGNQSSLVCLCAHRRLSLNSFISGCVRPQSITESDLFSVISGLAM